MVVDVEFPDWHLINDEHNTEYIIDFEKTKRLIFNMGNGKRYTFSLVREEESDVKRCIILNCSNEIVHDDPVYEMRLCKKHYDETLKRWKNRSLKQDWEISKGE